jgi:hypothetical protein
VAVEVFKSGRLSRGALPKDHNLGRRLRHEYAEDLRQTRQGVQATRGGGISVGDALGRRMLLQLLHRLRAGGSRQGNARNAGDD